MYKSILCLLMAVVWGAALPSMAESAIATVRVGDKSFLFDFDDRKVPDDYKKDAYTFYLRGIAMPKSHPCNLMAFSSEGNSDLGGCIFILAKGAGKNTIIDYWTAGESTVVPRSFFFEDLNNDGIDELVVNWEEIEFYMIDIVSLTDCRDGSIRYVREFSRVFDTNPYSSDYKEFNLMLANGEFVRDFCMTPQGILAATINEENYKRELYLISFEDGKYQVTLQDNELTAQKWVPLWMKYAPPRPLGENDKAVLDFLELKK